MKTTVEQRLRASLHLSAETAAGWLPPTGDAVVRAAHAVQRRRWLAACSAAVAVVLLAAAGVVGWRGPRSAPFPVAAPTPVRGLELRLGDTILLPSGAAVSVPVRATESIRGIIRVQGGWVVTFAGPVGSYSPVRFLTEAGQLREFTPSVPQNGVEGIGVEPGGRALAIVASGRITVYDLPSLTLRRDLGARLDPGRHVTAVFLTAERVVVQTEFDSRGPAGSGWVAYRIPLDGGPGTTVGGAVLDISRDGARAAVLGWKSMAEGGQTCLGVVSVGTREIYPTDVCDVRFAGARFSPDGRHLAVWLRDHGTVVSVWLYDSSSMTAPVRLAPAELRQARYLDEPIRWLDDSHVATLGNTGGVVVACAIGPGSCEPAMTEPANAAVIPDAR